MGNSINVSIDMAPLMERLENLEKRLERANSYNSAWESCPPLMSVKQTAEFLGVSESQVYVLSRRKGFPCTREIGGLKVTTHMLKIWIERHTEWIEDNTNFFSENAM